MVNFTSHSPSEPHLAEIINAGYFIRIEEGLFKGMEFSFKDLSPQTEDAEGRFHMKYDFDIWYAPEIDPEVTVREFRDVIEPILDKIILEVAEQIEFEDVESPEEMLEEPRQGPEFETHEIIGE